MILLAVMIKLRYEKVVCPIEQNLHCYTIISIKQMCNIKNI